MIAVAVAVILGVVAVTCGIVADSNHADSLTFLGVMVKTTAAQIFLSGAICTWALFASLWLLSVGVKRSKERGIELRAIKTLRGRGFPHASIMASGFVASGSDVGDEVDARLETDDDNEPTVTLDFDHLRKVIEAELARRTDSGRFYRADPSS